MRDPIFITGAARSGTSICTDLFNYFLNNSNTEIGEGFFVDIIFDFNKVIDDHFELNSSELSRTTLLSLIAKDDLKSSVLGIIKSYVERSYQGRVIIDKTPTTKMVKTIPIILSIWPNAKFIYVKRRGIENLSSRLRKFPELDFYWHCEDWVSNISAWHICREQVSSSNYIEIDHRDFIIAHDSLARKISGITGVDISGLEISTFLNNYHPQQTSANYLPLDFKEIEWHSEKKACFLSLCNQTMISLGYSYDQSYYMKS